MEYTVARSKRKEQVMTLAAIFQALPDLGASIGLPTDLLAAPAPRISNDTGDKLWTTLRGFLTPFVLMVFAVLSLVFLVRRQTTQLLQFVLIGAAVFALFWSPEIIKGIGEFIAGSL